MSYNNFTNLENFKMSLLGKEDYASAYIISRKYLFKNFWEKYNQIYKFNIDLDTLHKSSSIMKLTGKEIIDCLNFLPFDTFIIKPIDIKVENYIDYLSVTKNLQLLYAKSMFNIEKDLDNYEDDLVMVSYFTVKKDMYIFFAPTNYSGDIGNKAYVMKIDGTLTMRQNFKNIHSELVKWEVTKLHKLGGSLNAKAKSFGKRRERHIQNTLTCCRNVLKYLFYLANCNRKELSKNIKYVVGKKTYNIVADNIIIKDIKECNFFNNVHLSDEIIYYKNNEMANGTSKSTHTRRGHQHRYWVGSGDKKRLVTKWVEPIIVNEGKNELSTVINNIN